MATYAPSRIARARNLQGIYVILNEERRVLQLARRVLDAGVRLVQYRAKAGIVAENLEALRALTRGRDALLILNDDWRCAQRFDCDGVHLGPDDDGFDRVAVVREAMGERLIGLSCGSIEEVLAANVSDADYLGVGSVYVTPSKDDAGAPIGTQALHRLAAASTLPVAAVGGISAANIAEIRDSQVAMAAVVSAISDSTDPYRAARELVEAWQR